MGARNSLSGWLVITAWCNCCSANSDVRFWCQIQKQDTSGVQQEQKIWLQTSRLRDRLLYPFNSGSIQQQSQTTTFYHLEDGPWTSADSIATGRAVPQTGADLCNVGIFNSQCSLSLNLATKMSSADCGGWEESTRAAACKGGEGEGRGGDGGRCLDSRQTPQSLDGWLTPQPRPAGARLILTLNLLSLYDYSNFATFPTFPLITRPCVYIFQKKYADGWHWRLEY